MAVKKTTEELDNINSLTQNHASEKKKLEACCQSYEDKICCLITERDAEKKELQECCKNLEQQLSQEKMKTKEELESSFEQSEKKEQEYLAECCELKDNLKTRNDEFDNMETELAKANADCEELRNEIKTLQLKIDELTAECSKPEVKCAAVETNRCNTVNRCLNTAKSKCVNRKSQVETNALRTCALVGTDENPVVDAGCNTSRCVCVDKGTQSRFVKFEDRFDDSIELKVVKPAAANFRSESSMNCSGRSRKEELTFTDLESEKDDEVEEARKRICELEDELQMAWREKEKEVETARCCREQEIINLKEVINSLMKSLDNERQRSENLQKAVDLYLNSISVLQDSEEQLKKEYIDLTQVIDKLRDENLILEVDLFYYFQDVEIYEMRVLKYQQLLREMQGQCCKMSNEVQCLENQKGHQTAFVDDLSEQLSECQDELRHLFNVLTEEQNMVENESVTLNTHIMTLQSEMCSLSQKLAVTIQCLDNEKKNNNVLEYQLNIRDQESTCLSTEVCIMKEKLQQAVHEIISHQSTIINLQDKVQQYEKSITLLDEESEMCQNSIQFCFKSLKDTQLSLENRNKEYDVLKIEYSKELGVANNLRIELQQTHDQLNDCKNMIRDLRGEIRNEKDIHCKEINEYIKSVHNLQNELKEVEMKFKNTEQELQIAHSKLLEASESEADHVKSITDLNDRINSYMNEQERLVSVIKKMEDRISCLGGEINRKEDQINSFKMNLNMLQNTNAEQKQLYQEEMCNLKNEINTLIQKQGMLKTENEKSQAQLTKYHAIVAKNEEKGKLMVQELKQCLTELQTIQGDKEFLLQKNEQLAHEIQSLQDACQSKTESVVTLEMELNDTKCIRDTLCNESRNVISNVKAWLQEQRKINVELNNKIKQKNVLISQLNQEKMILSNKIKELSLVCGNSNGKSNNCGYNYRPQTSNSGPSWNSYGSTESASCSSDSEVDANEIPLTGTPQVWIHRVESLTEKLQRKNVYWKNKMDDHDYIVSKDK